MGKGSNKHNKSAKRASNAARAAVGAADKGRVQSGSDHAHDSDDVLSSHEQPQTCCPACQTVFEVPAELLASNDTRVRCGECLGIFDALISLRRDSFLEEDDGFLVDEEGNVVEPDSPYANSISDGNEGVIAGADKTVAFGSNIADSEVSNGHADEASELDVTYSDFDLFSGEVELPEVAYFDQTQDTQHLDFDETVGDQTFSDTFFSHDLTAEAVDLSPVGTASLASIRGQELPMDVEYVTDEIGQAPVDFRYRDPVASRLDVASNGGARMEGVAPHRDIFGHDEFAERPLGSGSDRQGSDWKMRATLALLLIVLVGALYSYRNRDVMLHNPVFRPWAERVCAVVGCQLPPVVALDALKVLKRSVFSHPTIEGSLVIDLAFVNQASFDQPYPILEIRLTDRNGRLVIQNDVTPADYLDQWRDNDLLQSGERLDLSLILEDPGQLATSFELKFR